MPLPTPRQGESIGFHVYPTISLEGTLGDPERIIWSSIRQLCSRSVAMGIAKEIHGVSHKRSLEAIANNIKVYLDQAAAFYEAAAAAKANTAPLFYYYSFLNLAKALVELKNPNIHQLAECYRHGISWRPNRRYTVRMPTEQVVLTQRGVWHLLWEALTGSTCQVANQINFRIRDLFAYCPEVSIEYEKTFGGVNPFVDLEKPDTLYDDLTVEAWIRFSVWRGNLKMLRLSRPNFIALIESPRSSYIQVSSTDSELWTFESAQPVQVGYNDTILDAVHNDVKAFNLFSHLAFDHIEYSIPIQKRLPIPLPQICILYTILFWLGSLVRYDPHSVDQLMDSGYWVLIDGVMSQSRIWLLEQFEWAMFEAETTLRLAR